MHFVLKDECGLRNWAHMMWRSKTKSQQEADIFPFWGDENLVKAIVLIGHKVVGKAIANRTRTRIEGEARIWGLVPRKNF